MCYANSTAGGEKKMSNCDGKGMNWSKKETVLFLHLWSEKSGWSSQK